MCPWTMEALAQSQLLLDTVQAHWPVLFQHILGLHPKTDHLNFLFEYFMKFFSWVYDSDFVFICTSFLLKKL